MMFYDIGVNTFLMGFITKFQNSNLIDFVSLLCITIPSFSLPFFKHLTRVAPEIILSQNIQLRSHWKKFIFASLLIYMFINIRFSKIEDEGIDYFWWTRLEAPSGCPSPRSSWFTTWLALMSTFTLIGKVVGYSRRGGDTRRERHPKK